MANPISPFQIGETVNPSYYTVGRQVYSEDKVVKEPIVFDRYEDFPIVGNASVLYVATSGDMKGLYLWNVQYGAYESIYNAKSTDAIVGNISGWGTDEGWVTVQSFIQRLLDVRFSGVQYVPFIATGVGYNNAVVLGSLLSNDEDSVTLQIDSAITEMLDGSGYVSGLSAQEVVIVKSDIPEWPSFNVFPLVSKSQVEIERLTGNGSENKVASTDALMKTFSPYVIVDSGMTENEAMAFLDDMDNYTVQTVYRLKVGGETLHVIYIAKNGNVVNFVCWNSAINKFSQHTMSLDGGYTWTTRVAETVVDNLNSSDTDLPLSANQGRVLSEMISDSAGKFALRTIDMATMSLQSEWDLVQEVISECIADFDAGKFVPVVIKSSSPVFPSSQIGYMVSHDTSKVTFSVATSGAKQIAVDTSIQKEGTFSIDISIDSSWPISDMISLLADIDLQNVRPGRTDIAPITGTALGLSSPYYFTIDRSVTDAELAVDFNAVKGSLDTDILFYKDISVYPVVGRRMSGSTIVMDYLLTDGDKRYLSSVYLTDNGDGTFTWSDKNDEVLNTSKIVDALTSTDATCVLSANQGRVLKEFVDGVNTNTLNLINALTGRVATNETDISLLKDDSVSLHTDLYALNVDYSSFKGSVQDNLTSSSAGAPLSANQGRILKGLIDNVSGGIRFEKVDVLPDTGENGIIYLVPQSGSSTSYNEFVWIDSSYEQIGSTDVILTGYVKGYNLIDVDGGIGFQSSLSFSEVITEIQTLITAGTPVIIRYTPSDTSFRQGMYPVVYSSDLSNISVDVKEQASVDEKVITIHATSDGTKFVQSESYWNVESAAQCTLTFNADFSGCTIAFDAPNASFSNLIEGHWRMITATINATTGVPRQKVFVSIAGVTGTFSYIKNNRTYDVVLTNLFTGVPNNMKESIVPKTWSFELDTDGTVTFVADGIYSGANPTDIQYLYDRTMLNVDGGGILPCDRYYEDVAGTHYVFEDMITGMYYDICVASDNTITLDTNDRSRFQKTYTLQYTESTGVVSYLGTTYAEVLSSVTAGQTTGVMPRISMRHVLGDGSVSVVNTVFNDTFSSIQWYLDTVDETMNDNIHNWWSCTVTSTDFSSVTKRTVPFGDYGMIITLGGTRDNFSVVSAQSKFIDPDLLLASIRAGHSPANTCYIDSAFPEIQSGIYRSESHTGTGFSWVVQSTPKDIVVGGNNYTGRFNRRLRLWRYESDEYSTRYMIEELPIAWEAIVVGGATGLGIMWWGEQAQNGGKWEVIPFAVMMQLINPRVDKLRIAVVESDTFDPSRGVKSYDAAVVMGSDGSISGSAFGSTDGTNAMKMNYNITSDGTWTATMESIGGVSLSTGRVTDGNSRIAASTASTNETYSRGVVFDKNTLTVDDFDALVSELNSNENPLFATVYTRMNDGGYPYGDMGMIFPAERMTLSEGLIAGYSVLGNHLLFFGIQKDQDNSSLTWTCGMTSILLSDNVNTSPININTSYNQTPINGSSVQYVFPFTFVLNEAFDANSFNSLKSAIQRTDRNKIYIVEDDGRLFNVLSCEYNSTPDTITANYIIPGIGTFLRTYSSNGSFTTVQVASMFDIKSIAVVNDNTLRIRLNRQVTQSISSANFVVSSSVDINKIYASTLVAFTLPTDTFDLTISKIDEDMFNVNITGTII